MLDTPSDILDKQREIISRKTLEERFLIGAELIDFGRIVVENSIKQNHPNITQSELNIEVLKRYYATCYSKNEFEKIVLSMINYYKNKLG